LSFLDRMAGLRTRRTVVLGIGVLIAAGTPLAIGHRRSSVETVPVKRGNLALTADVEGEIRALRSTEIGPPVVRDNWEYKITLLAAEGATVHRGDRLVAFDASPLLRALDEKRAELDESSKRIERQELETESQGRDLELQLAESESRLLKARSKSEVPEELRAHNEVRATLLELRGAEEEGASLRARIAALRDSQEASLKALRSQRDRARARVAELEAAVQAMTVTAPQDGIVIYKTGWRDEKRKVGDTVWFGEKLLQLPDLSTLYAEGDVDEADAALLAVGQRARLRLEALPDQDLGATVTRIARTVRRKSARVPSKVFRVQITFDHAIEALRPAMRFRGEIDTRRVPGALIIPREDVFPRPAGPVVWVRQLWAFQERPVQLGAQGRHEVQVVSGLVEGERVATTDLAQDASRP
jgi:HlyD family secretion protein